MKPRKARKRLERVEGLLTGILDNCTKADHQVHDLLGSAKTAVSDAILRLQKREVRKPPARATETSNGRAAASGRRTTKAMTNRTRAVNRVPSRKTA
jgi:hypothetical protein